MTHTALGYTHSCAREHSWSDTHTSERENSWGDTHTSTRGHNQRSELCREQSLGPCRDPRAPRGWAHTEPVAAVPQAKGCSVPGQDWLCAHTQGLHKPRNSSELSFPVSAPAEPHWALTGWIPVWTGLTGTRQTPTSGPRELLQPHPPHTAVHPHFISSSSSWILTGALLENNISIFLKEQNAVTGWQFARLYLMGHCID